MSGPGETGRSESQEPEPYRVLRVWEESWEPVGDGLLREGLLDNGLEVQYQWQERYQGDRLVSKSPFPLRRRLRGTLSPEEDGPGAPHGHGRGSDLDSVFAQWTTADRELAGHVLGHLYRGGGLKTLRRHVVEQGRTVIDLDRILRRLAGLGLVTLEERNRQTNREDYEFAAAALDPRTKSVVQHLLGVRHQVDDVEELCALVRETLDVDSGSIDSIGPVDVEARERLIEALRSQLAILEKPRDGSRGSPLSRPPSSSLPSPELVRLMCRVLTLDNPVPERVLSVELFADSKRLSALRQPFANAVGVELEDFGVYSHAHLLYFTGPLTFGLGGAEFSGCSITPFWALPEPALDKLTVVKTPTAILLVENQTCFEELGRLGLAESAGVLAVYAGGYLSSPERRLVELCLEAGTDRILTWMDPDPYGIDIVLAIRNEFGDRATVLPVLMDSETFRALEQRKPLEEADRDLIPRLHRGLQGNPDWGESLLELLGDMERSASKGEQEEELRVFTERELLAGLVEAL